jgi:D-tyrosyl-tRNA(Tyr) deacylase
VSSASVTVDGECVGEIDGGLLLLVGVEDADTDEDLDWIVRKVVAMRIFPDGEGKMNRSVVDTGGGVLVVSQFTLHASVRKGNRPSFTRAAAPDHARKLYEKTIEAFRMAGIPRVASGIFGADMKVQLLNDGPVTIWMDSKVRE